MIKGNVDFVKKMWSDHCTIKIQTSAQDERGFDLQEDKVIADNVPCKVVKKRLNAGNQSFFDNVKYEAVLLIGNEITVPKGADIIVTNFNNHVQKYKLASGGFSEYTTHQEIAMLIDDKA